MAAYTAGVPFDDLQVADFTGQMSGTGVTFRREDFGPWPREARDKAVVLLPYLQHSRTFDLRTEYQRWRAWLIPCWETRFIFLDDYWDLHVQLPRERATTN